ncbi:hypothetical protein JOE21_003509 [Desmospora profundinema]|uniref:Uncharacterized protein n=1 Tax=Desmospora profundinema TaxID=1571184 RepID=A0ABU1IRS1_9BACL|nr:hypothetical protein [Desmospora profundinema]
MDGHFGLRRLLLFLLVIATIFALVLPFDKKRFDFC